ncbi:hypothetical protein [Plectonema radiosum]|uniref:hypothetical protein n=1 Tax=Plectonema radiosum TaxID=945768 RepID=UPI00298235B2|nr:hypothetical protein [Plectonema radiosum]
MLIWQSSDRFFEDLAILPIAIASLEEISTSALRLRVLSLFDPSQPLFNQPGLHSLVIYRRKARVDWSSLLDYAPTQGKIPRETR